MHVEKLILESAVLLHQAPELPILQAPERPSLDVEAPQADALVLTLWGGHQKRSARW